MRGGIFADRMRTAMWVGNITVAQLHEATGINPNSIRDYQNGHKTPKPRNAVKIAKALKVPTSWLYGTDTATVKRKHEVIDIGSN